MDIYVRGMVLLDEVVEGTLRVYTRIGFLDSEVFLHRAEKTDLINLKVTLYGSYGGRRPSAWEPSYGWAGNSTQMPSLVVGSMPPLLRY
jgi:hypothetical protein